MRTLSLLLLLFSVICCPAQNNINYQSIVEKIDSFLFTHAIDGGQLVVVNKDSTLFQHNFGVKPGTTDPVTDENLFAVASLTKSFTALSILMLVEEGKLSLNDHLSDLVPEIPFTNPWEETHPIKVAHLLEHTTGWDKDHVAQFGLDRDSISLLKAIQYYPKSLVSRYPPGQFMSYTNDGPNVAGYIVEKISGMPYPDFVQQHILDPIGMKSSTLFNNNEYVNQYLTYDLKANDRYFLILDRPSAGMVTNATDMAKYLQFYLNQGRVDSLPILSLESLLRMQSPHTGLISKSGLEMGYGMGMSTREFKDIRFLSHAGGLPSFGSYMVIIPEMETAFFYACTSDESFVYDTPLITLLNAIIDPQGTWTAKEVAPAKDADIAGYYRSRTSMYEFLAFIDRLFNVYRIVEENGNLFLSSLFEKKKNPLHQYGDGLFYYWNEEGEKIEFAPAKDYQGKEVLVSTLGNLEKTSASGVWSRLIVTGICLFLLLTLPLVIIIRTVLKYLAKRKIHFNTSLSMGMVSVMSLLSIIFIFLFFMMRASSGTTGLEAFFKAFGEKTVYSFSIYVLSILFGVFSLLAFVFAILSFKEKMHSGLRKYSSMVGLALLIVTVYLWRYGFIGFQFWAY